MTQPTRKTLLALLRRWSEESYPYPSQELLDATREALAPDKRTPELPGQTSVYDFPPLTISEVERMNDDA